MSRHERNMREAQWTQEQAQAWVNGTWERSRSWTTRRYRVEGARGGNSRLLTLAAAEATQGRYGGKIVELIGPWPKPPTDADGKRLSKKRQAAAGMPACPRCKADPGMSCLRPNGAETRPHRERIKALQALNGASPTLPEVMP